jgi:hypothetical protein
MNEPQEPATRPEPSAPPSEPPVEPPPDTTWVTFEDISKSQSPDDFETK